MATLAMTFKAVETALCEDVVDKIAGNVHALGVQDLHTEMALELNFIKNRTPLEGLKAMFPNVMLFVHKIDEEQDFFDSFCVMDRVVIYRLNETDLLVLSEIKDCFYHAGYYRIYKKEKKVVLLKNKVYIKRSGYSMGDQEGEIDFIREALGLEDHSFVVNYSGENKWLLGSAMINWFIGAKDSDLGM